MTESVIPYHPDEEGLQTTDPQLPASTPVYVLPPVADQPDDPRLLRTRNSAESFADDALVRLRRYRRRGVIVTVNRDRLNEIVEDHAQAYARQEQRQAGFSVQEYRAIQETYKSAFWNYFSAGTRQPDEQGRLILEEEIIIQLWQDARQDKRMHMAYGRDWHIRDIGVIRVIKRLHCSMEQAIDRLSEIHKLADWYQEAYRVDIDQEEVIWPTDQETF